MNILHNLPHERVDFIVPTQGDTVEDDRCEFVADQRGAEGFLYLEIFIWALVLMIYPGWCEAACAQNDGTVGLTTEMS